MAGDAMMRTAQWGASAERFSLFAPLSAGVCGSVLTVPHTAAIRDALLALQHAKATAVVVVGIDGRQPLGILTLNDVLARIAIGQVDVSLPVTAVMTGQIVTLPSSNTGHQALTLMARRRFHHVVVSDAAGHVCGIVSREDLALPSGHSVDAISREFERVRSEADLTQLARGLRQQTAHLIDQGMGPQQCAAWLAAIVDLIVLRAIDMASTQHVPPQVPWCWLSLGAEARFEQSLLPEQEHGIVFDVPDGMSAETVRTSLLEFAREVNRLLVACGFRRSAQGILASQPGCCRTVAEWQQYYRTICAGEIVPPALAIFDMRPLFGDIELGEGLAAWLMTEVRQQNGWLSLQHQRLRHHRLPAPWHGWLQLDRHVGFGHTLDLKHGVLDFCSDLARWQSLLHGVSATHTLERLRQVGAQAQWSSPRWRAIHDAYLHVLKLLQRHQAHLCLQRVHSRDAVTDLHPWRIRTAELHDYDRSCLRAALRVVRHCQQSIPAGQH